MPRRAAGARRMPLQAGPLVVCTALNIRKAARFAPAFSIDRDTIGGLAGRMSRDRSWPPPFASMRDGWPSGGRRAMASASAAAARFSFGAVSVRGIRLALLSLRLRMHFLGPGLCATARGGRGPKCRPAAIWRLPWRSARICRPWCAFRPLATSALGSPPAVAGRSGIWHRPECARSKYMIACHS